VKLARAYLDSLAARGLSRRTSAIHTRGLRLFLAFLAEHRRSTPQSIRLEDVRGFCAAASQRRIERGPREGHLLHPATLATWLQAIRGFGRWLVRRGHLLLDPTTGLDPLPIPRALPRVLTPSEVDRLLATASDHTPVGLRDRAILELLYASGLRSSELTGLDLVDMDLADREVYLKRTKGGKSRRVPIGGPAVRALSAYLKKARDPLSMLGRVGQPTPAVFLSLWGTRLSGLLICRMIRRRARTAGLPGRVTPHTMRHTAAVHLLKGGADLRHIQEFLGHESVQTTAHYTRLALTDLKEAVRRCHPRARLGI
jgi:integrase/recombinase XerD